MQHSLMKEPPLLVHPQLALRIGLKEAMILQQIHYWLEPKRNDHFYEDRHWVHNTYEEWKEQFPFWASRTIQRAIFNLEDMGVLASRISREFKKTKFYTINYDQLNALLKPHSKGIENEQKEPDKHPVTTPKPKCPAQERADLMDESPYISQTHVDTDNLRSGQLDLERETVCPRSRQDGSIHHDKVARFYNPYTETTTETTVPPQSPPSSSDMCLRQEDEEDLKTMFKVWDEKVYQVLFPGNHLYLTQDRKTQMHQILKGLFDSKLEAWEGFCETIAACPFLMGQNEKNFRVTLDWALIPKNTLKILENDFYSSPSTKAKPLKERPWDEYEPSLRDELKHWPYQEEWLLICEAIVKCLGQVTFATWFQQLRPKEVSAERVTLVAMNSFTRHYILNEYESDLLKCIQAIYPQNPLINIEVDPGLILNEATTPHITKGDIHE